MPVDYARAEQAPQGRSDAVWGAGDVHRGHLNERVRLGFGGRGSAFGELGASQVVRVAGAGCGAKGRGGVGDPVAASVGGLGSAEAEMGERGPVGDDGLGCESAGGVVVESVGGGCVAGSPTAQCCCCGGGYKLTVDADHDKQVKITGLADTAASGTGTVTVADSFTVAPATATCTASPAAAAVAKGTNAADRTLTAKIAAPGSLAVTVTCQAAGHARTAQTVTFTAELAAGVATIGARAISGGECKTAAVVPDSADAAYTCTMAKGGTLNVEAEADAAATAAGLAVAWTATGGVTIDSQAQGTPTPVVGPDSTTLHRRTATATLNCTRNGTATAAAALGNSTKTALLAITCQTPVEIDGLDDTTKTGAGQVTVTFTVTPASATCTAEPAAASVSEGPNGQRTLSVSVGSPGSLEVTVACEAAGYVDGTRKVTLAAVLPCSEHLGTLASGRIERAGTITAAIECTSATRRKGSAAYYARRHTFTLDSPGWVTIDLANSPTNSSRLDTYLVLLSGHGGSGTQIESNDDGGPGTDSRLVDVFLQRGEYTIEATTYRTTATGNYDLRVEATVTGLQPSYDAYAGKELVVEFETGGFTPTASVTGSGLAVSATKSGTAASLSMTPSRTGAFSVTLSFSRPSGSGARSTWTAAARTVAASSAVIPVNSTCPAGQKTNPNPPAGTCILKSDAEMFAERGGKGRYRVTPALVAGTKKVAKASLDAYAGECGMRPGRLAAAMMAIGFWETPVTATALDTLYDVGDVKRDPARSPMTLSRGDFHQNGAQGKNAVLYPDNLRSGDADAGLPRRAFWHPGVGYWQLDTWESTKALNHAERADVERGGRRVADVLRDAYCRNNGSEAELVKEMNRQWHACEAGDCAGTYRNLYLGFVTGTGNEAFYVTTADNIGHHSVTGGAQMLEEGCRWGSTGTPFSCWFYDTDSYQGHADTGRATGDRSPATAISPYAAPFMSFTHDDKRYAVFPESFTGGTITRMKFVSTAKLVRTETANTWRTDTHNGGLQVRICQSPPDDDQCTWTDAADQNFKRRIRAVYPDANPDKNP